VVATGRQLVLFQAAIELLVSTQITTPNLIADREAKLLARYAMHSSESAGRVHPEIEHLMRGPFQRDRDRVLHSSAFRRLSGKTQVFTGQGDYHRTRLTHTMEVASIARTIGRSLRLNEDLIEALALLHDIGHPPFGHAGEEALDEMLKHDGGFSHNKFALTLVEELEQRYPTFPGLNLTAEVLGGQKRRVDKQQSDGQHSPLLEVQVVDLADSITYNAHDVDDAVELGWLRIDELLELPIMAKCHESVLQKFGKLEGDVLRRALVHELVNLQVAHLIYESQQTLIELETLSAREVCETGVRLEIAGPLAEHKAGLQKFLYARLYRHADLVRARREAQAKIKVLVEILEENEQELPEMFRSRCSTHGTRVSVVECIASMTDNTFLETYQRFAG